MIIKKSFVQFSSVFTILLSGCLADSSAVSRFTNIDTLKAIELNKYVGRWVELASIPQRFTKHCHSDAQAHYSLEENYLKIINQCSRKDGHIESAEARAKVVEPATNAKLKVTFVKWFKWIFAFSGNYWVIHVEPDYSVALIGDPDRKYAWLLARTPTLDIEIYKMAENRFRQFGYDTCLIMTTIQTDGLQENKPLCQYIQ